MTAYLLKIMNSLVLLALKEMQGGNLLQQGFK